MKLLSSDISKMSGSSPPPGDPGDLGGGPPLHQGDHEGLRGSGVPTQDTGSASPSSAAAISSTIMIRVS